MNKHLLMNQLPGMYKKRKLMWARFVVKSYPKLDLVNFTYPLVDPLFSIFSSSFFRETPQVKSNF
jgi:hypothetical protein